MLIYIVVKIEVMKAFVAGLSDEDMADLSAYYGSLKP